MAISKSTVLVRELLAVLIAFTASSSSHWYTVNGGTFSKLSLCCLLGFCSEVDYYACLVSAGLAGYNNRNGKKTLQLRKMSGKTSSSAMSMVCLLPMQSMTYAASIWKPLYTSWNLVIVTDMTIMWSALAAMIPPPISPIFPNRSRAGGSSPNRLSFLRCAPNNAHFLVRFSVLLRTLLYATKT